MTLSFSAISLSKLSFFVVPDGYCKVDELGKSLGNVSPISGGFGPGCLERGQFSLYNVQPSDRNHPAALGSPLEDVQITSGRSSSLDK